MIENRNSISSAEIKKLLDTLKGEQLPVLSSRAQKAESPRNYEQKLMEVFEARKRELENKSLEQDIELKRLTLWILFGFLAVETIAIFVMAWFQGLMGFGFVLDEWSFRLIVGSTIIQITIMLQVAVKHLFPLSSVKQD